MTEINITPYVIGIAGGTGSGKTTVAREIVAEFTSRDVLYIQFDNYYRDLSDMPFSVRAATNFDHPDSIESELIIQHLRQLKSGKSVEQPVYDFKTHSRSNKKFLINPAPVIVVEGILTFAYPELLKLLDMKIFVDTEADIRFIRRLERDIKERGRTMDNVVKQYLETVRPMHLEFVEPSKRYADIIIPEGRNDVALHAIISTIKHQITV
jgi:uridine kinase